ncbi:hypothetical protein THRCLA_02979 [Thraustotheca clavata]|uniref:Uncharacterized protein n=1 Tax=Thraustotheca clavata TaxID=74557 RepID=A0A1W0A3F0_9STRA|nr:hypothetical protein THRCLA_02979 [Thraustotheca clavata]
MNHRIKTIMGTKGCTLLASIEPVDRQLIDGRKKRGSNATDIRLEEAKRLIEEEKRKATTDKLLLFVLDAKAVYRNGGFGLSRGDSCIQRIVALPDSDKTIVDLSNIGLCDDLVASFINYLTTPTCPVLSLNIANTKLVSAQIIRVAKACSVKLEYFQASKLKLSTGQLRLKRVDFRKSGCDHLDLVAIGAFLQARRKASVQVLDLSENPLSGPKGTLFGGIESLSHAFESMQKLQQIFLDDVNLRSDGLLIISTGLQHTPSPVTLLSLSKNSLTINVTNQTCYDGIDALCEVLRSNHTILTLIIAANDLDYNCAAKIGDILRVNDKLQHLDMSENKFGSSGLTHITRALQFNPPLLELNLNNTNINSKAWVEITEALNRNSTLTTLQLMENPPIKEAGWLVLIQALEKNWAIIKFALTKPDSLNMENFEKINNLIAANIALTSVRKSLATFDFAALNPFSQVNFVNKLNAFSEANLCVLLTNQSFVHATMSSAKLSALRYYSSLEMYTPLRRLVWAYDAVHRKDALAGREAEKGDEELWQNQELISLPPITSSLR